MRRIGIGVPLLETATSRSASSGRYTRRSGPSPVMGMFTAATRSCGSPYRLIILVHLPSDGTFTSLVTDEPAPTLVSGISTSGSTARSTSDRRSTKSSCSRTYAAGITRTTPTTTTRTFDRVSIVCLFTRGFSSSGRSTRTYILTNARSGSHHRRAGGPPGLLNTWRLLASHRVDRCCCSLMPTRSSQPLT